MEIMNRNTKVLINRHDLYETFTFIATIIWSIIGFSIIGMLSYVCFKVNFNFTISSLSHFISDDFNNTFYILLFSLSFVLILGVISNICVVCASGDIITLAEYQKLPNKPKAYRI